MKKPTQAGNVEKVKPEVESDGKREREAGMEGVDEGKEREMEKRKKGHRRQEEGEEEDKEREKDKNGEEENTEIMERRRRK